MKDLNLLFFPGLGGSARQWVRQRPLAGKAVNLPWQEGAQACAAAVLDEIVGLDPERTVVVAHSIAGSLVSKAIGKGVAPRAVVFVDSPWMGEEKAVAAYRSFATKMLAEIQSPGSVVIRQWFEGLLGPTLDAEARQIVTEDFLSFDARCIFQNLLTLAEKNPPISIPTLVIESSRHLGKSPEMSWLRASESATQVQLDDVGHYVHLEMPDRFNKLVGMFVSGIE